MPSVHFTTMIEKYLSVQSACSDESHAWVALNRVPCQRRVLLVRREVCSVDAVRHSAKKLRQRVMHTADEMLA